jgi:hypothetical protein
VNWPDDGSISQNMLPVLQIDNKLFVVFQINIIFYFIFVLGNTTGWPQSKKIKLLFIVSAMMYHDKFYILWLHYQKVDYSNAQ